MKALLICLLTLPAFTADRNDWVLKSDKDGIHVYSRRSDCSRFNDTRVDLDLPGTVEQLAAILRDVDRYPDWVYSTRNTNIIQQVGRNEVVYYAVIGTPWPAEDRDYYADLKLNFNAADQSMTVLSVGLKNFRPEKKDFVRVPMSRACWTVRTESAHKIHLQYTLQIDPGGEVPAWILNHFSTRAPIETFSNLKKKLEDLNR
ncbi:MAG TPA: START domain-containing protein [Puia sp.]|nr:START domain-containing protein [Puia sp.]